MSTFRGLGRGDQPKTGCSDSLYADRASHYWHTPEAGGGVDKDNPTQVGRALAQLGIELIAAYSPQARGRSERMFGTLHEAPAPGAAPSPGCATMAEANRFRRGALLAGAQRPLRPPGRGHRLGLRWLLPARIEDIL